MLEVINTQEISQEITQENVQEKILKIIKEDPTVTRKILAIRLKKTPDSIKYYLDKMKKAFLIHAVARYYIAGKEALKNREKFAYMRIFSCFYGVFVIYFI